MIASSVAKSVARSVASSTAGIASGVSSGLPSGAIAAWFADEYASAPRPYIPNSIAPASPANLFSAPSRLFNSTVFWAKTAVTVVDGAENDPSGKANASTVVWASADAYLQQNMTLDAGTYTVAIDVATTDAATVNVRTGTSTSMATASVNGTWSTISHTFAHAGGSVTVLPIRSVNSSTPANLKVANARLFSGSSDLGATPLDGTMLLGKNAVTSVPTYTGGVLVNGSWFGSIQFADPITLGDYTVIALGAKQSAVSTEQSIISKVTSYTDFSAQWSSNGKAGNHIAGSNPFAVPRAGLWQPKTSKWDTIANRRSDTACSQFLNGALAYTATKSGTTTIQDLFVNILSSASFPSNYSTAAIAIWDRALTDEEALAASRYLETRFSSLSPRSHEVFIVLEGDSITADSYAIAYGNTAGPNLTVEAVGINNAVSGSWLDVGSIKVTDRTAFCDAVIPADGKNGTVYVYSLMIGRNDGLTYSGGHTAYAAAVASLLNGRKTAGFDKTVLCTVLPSTLANFNSNFQVPYNALITGAGWASANNIDAVCDFTTVTESLDASNVTYYSDGTHPTQALQDLLAVKYKAVIDAL